MADKRQCAGKIVNPKNAKYGEQCSRWAKRGSDYCNLHGGNRVSGPGFPETLERRCIGRRKNGKQCKKPPIAGAVVCQSHGAGSPYVKLKAQARLAALVDPATTILYDLLMKKGVSDSDRLRTIMAIYDRAGLSPSSRMEIGVEVKRWERTMDRIVKDLPVGELEAVPSFDASEAQEVEVEVEPEPVHPRAYLPQIIPPDSANERATYRIGSPLERPRPRHSDGFAE